MDTDQSPLSNTCPADLRGRREWLPKCPVYRTFLGLTLGLLLAAVAQAAGAATDPSPAREKELVRMVRQECGFCHGLRLTGGLGSPLTAEAMKDRPAETMAAVIQHGIPGTAMPPWAPFLSETESVWIVERLKEGFPNDVR
jgi:cytochrome c55X